MQQPMPNAGTERPVVFLIDIVSSHIDLILFSEASAKCIKLHVYRIVPNATHLMETMGKDVFRPLKLKLHLVVRK